MRSALGSSATLKPNHQKAFENFDSLPDSAKVPVQVVAALEGVTPVTIWRRSAAGSLPKPVKDGGATRWIVGALRAARVA